MICRALKEVAGVEPRTAIVPSTRTNARESDKIRRAHVRFGPTQVPGAGPAGPQHHYTLTLYALSVMATMEGKVLARGIFMGRYKQP